MGPDDTSSNEGPQHRLKPRLRAPGAPQIRGAADICQPGRPTSTDVKNRERLHHVQRRSIQRTDRRFPPGHRCSETQRHHQHLRPAGHPGHGPDPHDAGRRPARDLVPPRAERRQRRRHRRFHDRQARHLPDGVRARLPQRPDRPGQRHHQLLPHDPDLRLFRARDRRPAAG